MEILNNLVVYSPANKKIRIGRPRDGGYVIISDYQYDFLISGGIGGDISFEIDFIKRYPSIQGIAFDGTVNAPLNLPPNIKFIKKNVGYTSSEKTTNLREYISKYKNVFIKMDVEGGEWEVLRAFPDYFVNVKQLVFEAHGFLTRNKQKAIECLQLINKTHYLVHVHENNNGGEPIRVGSTECPPLLEFTFIRKDCEIRGLNTENFPINDLDFPNVTGKVQHKMDMWPFKSVAE